MCYVCLYGICKIFVHQSQSDKTDKGKDKSHIRRTTDVGSYVPVCIQCCIPWKREEKEMRAICCMTRFKISNGRISFKDSDVSLASPTVSYISQRL